MHDAPATPKARLLHLKGWAQGKFADRRVKLALAVLAVLVIGAWLYQSWAHEETDDANVVGHIHSISPRVAGTVAEVLVQDNEKVAAGQPLVRLDTAEYQVKVDQAQATYDRAKSDYDRLLPLQGNEAISQQDSDTSKEKVKVAAAQLQDAKNQLDWCTLRAPTDGRVGRKQVEAGNRVAPGSSLMAVVDGAWVVANFKETQIGRMRVGQPVSLKIDGIPGRTFRGHIESFAPGTGSTFALLPPDNATGNFTKVVQRVPVKIVLEPESIRGVEDRVLPGLSAIPVVDLTK
ncbi:membrane fusion protein, multidrug efflux system [Verrucomicrobium sp. GAS474]|uniref:HlyD family secretion protein n=1 Tax=Verrucomicrobium sp. GAS474 TaxID=1882831 RepID=UPI00087C4981|nr:HlyD family secretion protein [Verrucomicrobium sp. GAS474]SDU06185.1 membrane fusion protein, multidrug efflux system [Verrucomicrobium sp. GAS474]